MPTARRPAAPSRCARSRATSTRPGGPRRRWPPCWGTTERAAELTRQAEALRERFEQAFWCEELSTYALALDGDKRPCRVRTSNAGQCLFTGIASPERAGRVARTLLSPESFSGWGVRTVAASESRYNPMGYHNGSVWPHDNALIAQGLARYGLAEKALQIWTGLFEAGLYFDLHRMPELFCGFPQEPGEGPVLYPVACAPQAWSAASVFLLFQACLGLEINGPEAEICLHPAAAAGVAGRAADSQPGSGGGDGRSAAGPPRARRGRQRAAPRRGRPDHRGEMTRMQAVRHSPKRFATGAFPDRRSPLAGITRTPRRHGADKPHPGIDPTPPAEPTPRRESPRRGPDGFLARTEAGMLEALLFAVALLPAQAPDEAPEPVQITAPVLPPLAAAPPAPAPAAPLVPPPARWPLMKELQGTFLGSLLDDNRLSLSGWTEVSFTASTDAHDQLPMGFNYRANDFLLQQNWLRFERTVVTSGTTEPTFGFRCDTILPGSDCRFTLPRGLFDEQLAADHGRPATYGIDPIQFYGEAYIPTVARGLDVKVGRVFCQYGVEANDAVSNALASHAYTFIYDPFTHTGVMTTTKLTDAWSVQAGAMLGSDVFIDPADELTGMGSVKWAPPGGRDSVLFSVIAGPGRFNAGRNFNNPEIFDLVCMHQFGTR